MGQLAFDLPVEVRSFKEADPELVARFAQAWRPPATHNRVSIRLPKKDGVSLLLDLARYVVDAKTGYLAPADYDEWMRKSEREQDGVWIYLSMVEDYETEEYGRCVTYYDDKSRLNRALRAYLWNPSAAVVELRDHNLRTAVSR